MSKNAATEERLGELHAALAETLIKQLDGRPILQDGEIVGYEVDPRIISAAISFLNNNKIKANPFLTEEMSEIEKRLTNRRTKFRKVDGGKAALRAAANE
jgi:hypothetical protein